MSFTAMPTVHCLNVQFTATPPAVSPRVSGGISFRKNTHFVSDDPSGKFYAMITRGWRRRKSETKRNAKKSAHRSRQVRRMTPTSPPRREGPVISGSLIQNELDDFKKVVITFACRNTRRSRCFGLKPPEANMSVKNTASQVAHRHWRNTRAEVPGMRRRSHLCRKSVS